MDKSLTVSWSFSSMLTSRCVVVEVMVSEQLSPVLALATVPLSRAPHRQRRLGCRLSVPPLRCWGPLR